MLNRFEFSTSQVKDWDNRRIKACRAHDRSTEKLPIEHLACVLWRVLVAPGFEAAIRVVPR
jgi:hypothetical protein